MNGDAAVAIEAYERAAQLTSSLPEQHYLQRQAARLRQARQEIP